MPFYISGTTFCETKIAGMIGQAGLGFYRLVVQVEFLVRERREDSASLVDLGGDLMVQGKGGGTHYVGRLQPMTQPTIEAKNEAWSTQESMDIEMDRRRLEALEDIRVGGDLSFTVSLRARILSRSGFQQGSDQQTYRVNQGTWVEVLQQLGYARTMLLEVPIPDERNSLQLADAAKHFGQAHQAMLRGNWRETVGCCRDVMESLALALGDGDLQDPEVKALFDNSRSMDKAARLRVLRRALKLLTHPARHADEVSAKFEWDRTDATTMVSMVAALMQRLAG